MAKNLFSQNALRNYLEQRKSKLEQEINSRDLNSLQNSDKFELNRSFLQKYQLCPPKIVREKISRSDSADIDSTFSQSQGTKITFYIPFDGDSKLFDYKPSSHPVFIFEDAFVANENELALTLISTNQDPERLQNELNNQIDVIEKFLSHMESEISEFNNEIAAQIESLIAKRIEKLQKDQRMVESLGIPIKRRENPPQTHKVPDIRRRPEIRRPQVKQKPSTPDPYLDIEEYNHILNVIFNMVRVMELSPKAFKNLEEEDLRFHFLVQLNGQYEGRATGETFNFEGKTDILIKEDGKNLFIAECKFWGGPKRLLDTIDQLLNYVTWRDTKTAVIIFNRNKEFSAVLEKIKEAVKRHPHYVRTESDSKETEFRYIFKNKDDEQREFFLTILAFDVPQ